MSLIELKHYLQEKKIASLGDITEHFQCDAELARHMLQHWIRKGCICAVLKTPACSACRQCNVLSYEIYQVV